ncbi:uncharacterized protein LOC128989461 [Macrosteles quadrilineatus]|uniref:uncharacterized protein LOC128989461 n=1 Tax=Macrosteles quadrilineatus TaxID=74068 RepID=UPI0023E21657|nr:uncharacterized protein LOC128989461 [Macrosteles quadrilineatus]
MRTLTSKAEQNKKLQRPRPLRTCSSQDKLHAEPSSEMNHSQDSTLLVKAISHDTLYQKINEIKLQQLRPLRTSSSQNNLPAGSSSEMNHSQDSTLLVNAISQETLDQNINEKKLQPPQPLRTCSSQVKLPAEPSSEMNHSQDSTILVNAISQETLDQNIIEKKLQPPQPLRTCSSQVKLPAEPSSEMNHSQDSTLLVNVISQETLDQNINEKQLQRPRPLQTCNSQDKLPAKPSSEMNHSQGSTLLVNAIRQDTLDQNINEKLIEKLKGTCAKMKQCGQQLEYTHKDVLNRTFEIFRDSSQNVNLDPTSKLSVQELAKLRANKWSECETTQIDSVEPVTDSTVTLPTDTNAIPKSSLTTSEVLDPGEILNQYKLRLKQIKSHGKTDYKTKEEMISFDTGKVSSGTGKSIAKIKSHHEDKIKSEPQLASDIRHDIDHIRENKLEQIPESNSNWSKNKVSNGRPKLLDSESPLLRRQIRQQTDRFLESEPERIPDSNSNPSLKNVSNGCPNLLNSESPLLRSQICQQTDRFHESERERIPDSNSYASLNKVSNGHHELLDSESPLLRRQIRQQTDQFHESVPERILDSNSNPSLNKVSNGCPNLSETPLLRSQIRQQTDQFHESEREQIPDSNSNSTLTLEYSYTVILGKSAVKMSSTDLEAVNSAKLVLEEFYNIWQQRNSIRDNCGGTATDMLLQRKTSSSTLVKQPPTLPLSSTTMANTRKYSKHFLLSLSVSQYSHLIPAGWDSIRERYSVIVKK